LTTAKPRLLREETAFVFVRVEFVFDREAIGEGDAILVDALLELSHPAAQLVGAVMAVVVASRCSAVRIVSPQAVLWRVS
jgi:hypothetical protein